MIFFLLRIQIKNSKKNLFFCFGCVRRGWGEGGYGISDYFYYESKFKIIFFWGGEGGEGGLLGERRGGGVE